MKIKYLSGPKSGQIEFVQNQVGSVVVGAGLAEEITDGAVTAPNIHGEETYRLPKPGDYRALVPEWAVEVRRDARDLAVLVITMKCGDMIVHFCGHPERVNARKQWQDGSRWLNGFGRECPQEIAKEYERRWKDNPKLRGEAIPINQDLAGASGGAVAQNKTQAEVQAKLKEAEINGDRVTLNRPAVLNPGDDSEVIWTGSRQ
jgi:hypothetical protein